MDLNVKISSIILCSSIFPIRYSTERVCLVDTRKSRRAKFLTVFSSWKSTGKIQQALLKNKAISHPQFRDACLGPCPAPGSRTSLCGISQRKMWRWHRWNAADEPRPFSSPRRSCLATFLYADLSLSTFSQPLRYTIILIEGSSKNIINRLLASSSKRFLHLIHSLGNTVTTLHWAFYSLMRNKKPAPTRLTAQIRHGSALLFS